MKTFMIRQNGDLLVNLIEIKSDRCRDEIGHSYLVIGNRIMGWESLGQAMPHRCMTNALPRNPLKTQSLKPRIQD